MKFDSMTVWGDGWVFCKSNFYTVVDILPREKYDFYSGVNTLIDEIDSGIWALSYMLSMYSHRKEDFALMSDPIIRVNEQMISLEDLSDWACYMDLTDPLFQSEASVKALVSAGLQKRSALHTAEDIATLFHISQDRFTRPLTGVGNEIFKAMAAIGYSYGKQLFCFPWLSQKRFEGYHNHLPDVLNTLKSLNAMVLCPVGNIPNISTS